MLDIWSENITYYKLHKASLSPDWMVSADQKQISLWSGHFAVTETCLQCENEPDFKGENGAENKNILNQGLFVFFSWTWY